MRKLICNECGKHYDYDVDDFCPKCGAFNRPEKRTTVSRVEGMNEDNHKNSFVHTEMHDENRARHGGDLSHGTQRVPQATATQEAPPLRVKTQEKTEKPNVSLMKIVRIIVGAIILLNVLPMLFRLFFYF